MPIFEDIDFSFLAMTFRAMSKNPKLNYYLSSVWGSGFLHLLINPGN